MALVKKKQDEKNLKILREQVSLIGNRQCFDCHQKGPTYVNMTIGSFVCTTCSGLLRGLTPPHRVKSISMASFSKEEIDFLRDRGNEFCKSIWLGLVPQNFANHYSDKLETKDFMIEKYELKKYYLDPNITGQLLSQVSSNFPMADGDFKNSNSSGTHSSGSFLSDVPFPLITKKNQDTSICHTPSNFIADFSKAPPPLPVVITTKFDQAVLQSSFANFDNFIDNLISDNLSLQSSKTTKFTNPAPPEDRYAALKDLDTLMKQVTAKNDSKSMGKFGGRKVDNDSYSSWSIPSESSIHHNPFDANACQSCNITNDNNENSHENFNEVAENIHSLYNPFELAQDRAHNNEVLLFRSNSQSIDKNSFCQLINSSNKFKQQDGTNLSINPFSVHSDATETSRKSKNPFL